MCDYSLHNVITRPAKVGDKLVTTSFRDTDTRGFAAIEHPNIAVCLLPGTELAFEREIESEGRFLFFRRWKSGVKTARFRQVNVNQSYVHHDAIELANGKIVLLTDLSEGQMATVLQLPAAGLRIDQAGDLIDRAIRNETLEIGNDAPLGRAPIDPVPRLYSPSIEILEGVCVPPGKRAE